jgi:hypothetical protein
MKAICTFFVVFCLVINGYSQVNCECDSSGFVKYFGDKLIGKAFVNVSSYNNARFFNAWAMGNVYLTSGTTIRNLYLRYDKITDELHWLRDSDLKTIVINKNIVNSFWISQSNRNPPAEFIRKHIKIWSISDSVDCYIQILVKDTVSLYVLRNTSVSPSNYIDLIDNNHYYIEYKGEMHHFTAGRHKLLQVMGTGKEHMRNVIRKEKLHVRHEFDLIKAVKLYNQP